jgi:hypothetical protein
VVGSQDHDQMVRWMKFLEEHEDEGDIVGIDLLKAMELVDENVLVGSVEKADQDYDSGAGDREMLDVDDEKIELGKQILQSLEREEEEEELDGATTGTEDHEELDKEVVEKMIKEKQDMQGFNPCKRMRRSSKEKWGPCTDRHAKEESKQ